jgi:hypothetical protein
MHVADFARCPLLVRFAICLHANSSTITFARYQARKDPKCDGCHGGPLANFVKAPHVAKTKARTRIKFPGDGHENEVDSWLYSSIDFIRAGKLRAPAVTTAMRQEVMPDIPTVGEFVPAYETTAWFGIGAPKNTPSGFIEKLNREINAGLADRR